MPSRNCVERDARGRAKRKKELFPNRRHLAEGTKRNGAAACSLVAQLYNYARPSVFLHSRARSAAVFSSRSMPTAEFYVSLSRGSLLLLIMGMLKITVSPGDAKAMDKCLGFFFSPSYRVYVALCSVMALWIHYAGYVVSWKPGDKSIRERISERVTIEHC